MERREFLKLVAAGCAGAAAGGLTLAQSFAQVSKKTGYIDELILSMAESADKSHVVIEVSRWFTTRECWEIKHAWEHAFLGQPIPTPTEDGGYVWNADERRNEDRDVHIRAVNDVKPEGSHCILPEYAGFDATWLLGDQNLHDNIKVILLKPDPAMDSAWDDWVGAREQEKERFVGINDWNDVKGMLKGTVKK